VRCPSLRQCVCDICGATIRDGQLYLQLQLQGQAHQPGHRNQLREAAGGYEDINGGAARKKGAGCFKITPVEKKVKPAKKPAAEKAWGC